MSLDPRARPIVTLKRSGALCTRTFFFLLSRAAHRTSTAAAAASFRKDATASALESQEGMRGPFFGKFLQPAAVTIGAPPHPKIEGDANFFKTRVSALRTKSAMPSIAA